MSFILQDLSAFAMPLFDSEAAGDATNHASLDLDDGDGPGGRLSSGRGEASTLTPTGIKGWFRKRQKSGEPEIRGGGGNISTAVTSSAATASARPAHASPLQQQASPVQGTKMKHLLDSFRPRSRSDVAWMNSSRAQQKSKSGQGMTAQTTVPSSSSATSAKSSLAKKVQDAGAFADGHTSRNGNHSSSRHASESDRMSVDQPSTPTKTSGGHIGPEEFLEMYRERAYSDPRRAKEAALAARNKMKRVSKNIAL